MSASEAARVGADALALLRALHECGCVHGRMYSDSLVRGVPGTPLADALFLVGLRRATPWRDPVTHRHVDYEQRHNPIIRATCLSLHLMLGRTPTRRDDLESLAYRLIRLQGGLLPWDKEPYAFFASLQRQSKAAWSMDAASIGGAGVPPSFIAFARAACALRFDEEPPYAALAALLDPAAAGPERSLDSRPPPAGGTELGWLAVLGSRAGPAVAQRCLFDVPKEHVASRLADAASQGLHVSCASCRRAAGRDLRTLVLDAGTGFSEQVWYLSEPEFLGTSLPQEWIVERWENGYHITSLAGSASGAALVVMSTGTPYTQQCYKVSDEFPFGWVEEQWKQGCHVTSMATLGEGPRIGSTIWAVVVSRNADFVEQVVEVDCGLSSDEGVRRRWDAGAFITAASASPDMAAFALSVPRRRFGQLAASYGDGAQAAIVARSSAALAAQLPARWAQGMGVVALAYGIVRSSRASAPALERSAPNLPPDAATAPAASAVQPDAAADQEKPSEMEADDA